MPAPLVSLDTAASVTRLCTLEQVKLELQLFSDRWDEQLERFLDEASAELCGEEGLGRPAWRQQYTMKLPGPGGPYLLLPRWPVESVDSVSWGTGDSPTTVEASTYSIANERADRLYRPTGWATSTGEPGHVLPEYTVQAWAGWLMPGERPEDNPAAARALPADIVGAGLLAVRYKWRLWMRKDPTVRSEAFAGHTLTYSAGPEHGNIPEAAFKIMRRWRR